MQITSPPCEELDTALKKIKETFHRYTLHPKHMGIRQTVMLSFGFFVFFLIFLLWLFQIVFLDSFYRSYKAGRMSAAADTLVHNLSESSETLSSLAGELAEHNDLCILLLDESMDTLLSAEGSRNCLIHRTSPKALSFWVQKAPEDGRAVTELFHMNASHVGPVGRLLDKSGPDFKESGYRSAEEGEPDKPSAFEYDGKTKPDENDVQSMLYIRRVTLSDGTAATLFLNTQINPVASTVEALRSQLMVITLIVTLVALVLSFLISSRISRPIIETNIGARALSHAQYQRAAHAGSYREIRELNDTLSKAAEDLGRVDRLQQELIANISHDLRTPLTMIGGYAEIMRDIPSENTPENMQIIMDETARLSSLVTELLDFSRLRSGSTVLSPTVFCLTHTVSAIIDRVSHMTARDGYTVTFDFEKDVMVKADEKRVEQVVYNLLGNALTYTGESKRAFVTQSVRDGYARIEIRDEGQGIPEDEIGLIWNRYYRTSETHRRAVIGSGLGLNIVQTILEQHKAPYGVNSTVGKGTTFWFELPLVGDAAPDGKNPGNT